MGRMRSGSKTVLGQQGKAETNAADPFGVRTMQVPVINKARLAGGVEGLGPPGQSTGMQTPRITLSDLGPIFHRARTELSPVTSCRKGHRAPRYRRDRSCVICAKAKALSSQGNPKPAPRRVPNLMRRFADYGEARACHEEIGGWLLVLDDGRFGCTDNPRTVQIMRGRAWTQYCDRVGSWDEVEVGGPSIQARPIPPERARAALYAGGAG